jgi:anti-sigma B factor antagonist
MQSSDRFAETVAIAVGMVGSNGSSLPQVTLTGELDISGVPAVEAALAEVERAGPAAIVLDLRDLQFLDSSALRCVVRAHTRAQDAGRRLAILTARASHVATTFALVGLDEHLALYTELDAALAG